MVERRPSTNSCRQHDQSATPHKVTKALARLLSLLWRGYQICGEITCREVTLWRGYSPIFQTFQLHFGFSRSFSAILHLNFIGKHIGLCFESWDAEL